MHRMKPITTHCKSAEEMIECGERLGKLLKGGEIIELRGDVGAGKTTFVRGLARGIGSGDHVSSPTFTVSNVYNGHVMLHHLDLYRLADPGLMAHELAEIIDLPGESVVIEWAETVQNILPPEHIVISFLAPQENERVISVVLPEVYGYLAEAL